MIPVERQRAIMRLLTKQGSATIAELTALLDVSHMTVRRDIVVLEAAGKVTSVHGGVSMPARLAFDQSHAVKSELQQAEKQAIARFAATLVSAGDLVYIDAGTTGLAIAGALAHRTDVSFLTNDLAVATFLSGRPGLDLFLTGGQTDRANLSLEGELAARSIKEFNIDISFMSTSSFDLRGISVPSSAKKLVKEAIVDSSTRTVLATDSTKYGRIAAHRAVPLRSFDDLITDAALPESAQASITEQGIALHLAEPTS